MFKIIYVTKANTESTKRRRNNDIIPKLDTVMTRTMTIMIMTTITITITKTRAIEIIFDQYITSDKLQTKTTAQQLYKIQFLWY